MARHKPILSLFYNRITLVLLILAVGFMGVTALQLLTKERQAEIRKQNAVRELESIQVRKKVLTQELSALATERGREALVRGIQDVAREGEEIYIVLDAPVIATTTLEEKETFWEWVVGIFHW